MAEKKKKNLIKPRLLRGFRDYLAKELIARDKIIEKIKMVYELYGYTPLSTPALEPLDVLVGGDYGEEGTKQIYHFEDFEDENVGLRFDLTVPLARVFSQYRDLPRPFRRYQVAPVWRGDKPDPGRFREFIQFDIDIVGTSLITADAEIISVAHDAFLKLGLDNFCIRVNNRKVLNLLLKHAKIPEGTFNNVIRVIDKLDKHGITAVRDELTVGRTDKSGDKIPGLGLEQATADIITMFLENSSSQRTSRKEAIKFADEFFKGMPDSDDIINELTMLDECLTALDISNERVVIDLNLARGLDYYTGFVFEGILLDLPEYGSVFGGGRYDGLVKRFSGQDVPATGASIGVDRLFSALVKLNKITLKQTNTQVIVTTMDKNLLVEYLKIADDLRKNNIYTELYQGKPRNIKKQLEYADKIDIPIAVIMGSDELDNNHVTIKNLVEGAKQGSEIAERDKYLKERFAQITVSRGEMVDTIKSMLQNL